MADSEFKLRYVIQGDASGMRPANAELQKFDKTVTKLGAGKQLSGLLSGISGVATGSQLSGFTSQITSASTAMSALPGPAGVAIGAIALLGTAAVGAGVALFGLAKSASDYGSEIFDASEKTGLGAETLTAMKLAADQSSSSLEEVTGGITKFSKLVGEAALGSDKAAAALTRLGVDPKEAIKDLDGALGTVFKRIAALPPGVQQSKAAMDAFGKSGASLLPFIKSFNGDLPGLIAKAKELGVVMSDSDARAADEFGDQMDTLNAQLKMVAVTFGQELMPVFKGGAEYISGWLSKNKGEVRAWGAFFADTMTGAASATTFAAGVIEDQSSVINSALNLMTFGGLSNINQLLDAITLGGHSALMQGRADYNKTAELIRQAQAGASIGQRIGGTRIPGGDSDYLDNLKDAADKARKEALERAKRDNAAMIAVEQMYIKDVEAIYSDSIASAERNLSLGGRIDVYKKEILDANAYLQKQTKDSYAKIAALENLAADRDQKSATEQETLRQQQADRLSQIEIQTGKATLDAEEKARAESAKRQEQGYSIATANIAAQYDLQQANLDLAHETALMSELQYQEARNKLILEELDKELQAMKLAGKSKDEIALQELKIRAAKVRAQQSERAAEKKDAADAKKEREEAIKAFYDLAEATREAAKAQDEYNARRQGETTVGSSTAISSMDELREHFVGQQNTAAIAGVDALAFAFDGLGQAIGTAVEAWVLYGNAGQSVRQITAQILAGIAQQAAVKAIFELAEGFAALAMAFFGIPNAGPSATMHFKSAAIYGTVAAGAALAGRAVAGNSFNQGGTTSASSGSSASGPGRGNAANPTYTRTNPDAYMSGNREIQALAAEVRALHQKIGSKPGEVLVADALRRNPEMAGNAVVNANARNPSIGKKFLKDSGIK